MWNKIIFIWIYFDDDDDYATDEVKLERKERENVYISGTFQM